MGMVRSERRASRRYEFVLPARFRNGSKTQAGRVTSVGRHGVFVETGSPRKKGELFQLTLDIPSLSGQTAGVVRVMAVAAWSLGVLEAAAAGRPPGMGVKFFMMDAEDKLKWDQFYLALQHKMDPELDQRRLVASQAGPPKFYIRPRDFLQMFRFQKHSLASGGYFLRSPFIVPVGNHVQVVMIHPDSKEEFPLTGKVVNAVATGPVPLRGMGLEWCNVVMTTHQDFHRFVIDGIHPIEDIDLRLAS